MNPFPTSFRRADAGSSCLSPFASYNERVVRKSAGRVDEDCGDVVIVTLFQSRQHSLAGTTGFGSECRIWNVHLD